MIQYAVVAFPRSDALEAIEALRRRFDPQAALLSAHVTLAFPFPATMSVDQLGSHLDTAVRGLPPFNILLGAPTAVDGEYVFLDVVEGTVAVRTLHERVYTGPLAAYKSPDRAYRPHITLGRIRDTRALAFAVEDAKASLSTPVRATIAEISIFRLESATRGAVATTIALTSMA